VLIFLIPKAFSRDFSVGTQLLWHLEPALQINRGGSLIDRQNIRKLVILCNSQGMKQSNTRNRIRHKVKNTRPLQQSGRMGVEIQNSTATGDQTITLPAINARKSLNLKFV